MRSKKVRRQDVKIICNIEYLSYIATMNNATCRLFTKSSILIKRSVATWCLRKTKVVTGHRVSTEKA